MDFRENREMQTVSIKIPTSIVTRMNEHMEKSHYTTLSEFIRDAIRDKLDALENQKFESQIRDYLHNSSKNVEVAKNADFRAQEIERAKKDIFMELERKFSELREQTR